jgi:hypothetical protein
MSLGDLGHRKSDSAPLKTYEMSGRMSNSDNSTPFGGYVKNWILAKSLPVCLGLDPKNVNLGVGGGKIQMKFLIFFANFLFF